MTNDAILIPPKAVIFIGLQASGKSTFYNRQFSDNYVHVNLDTLHTRNKEAKLLEECFCGQKSFVVDNTNPTVEERKKYIQASQAHGYLIEGYFFQSVVRECMERNSLRSGKACVPARAIAYTSNRLELPSWEEGFHRLYYVSISNGDFTVQPWKES